MPPLALRIVAGLLAVSVAAALLVVPAIASGEKAYLATVKVISGAVAVVGSLYLSRAVSLTLLRSGGIRTFNAAYLAAVSLAGLGSAEAVSAFRPGNIGYVLAAYCIVSTVSGLLWLRFYARNQ